MDRSPSFLLLAEEVDWLRISWSVAHNDIRWSNRLSLHEAFLGSLVEAELAFRLTKFIRRPSILLLWLFYWREFTHSFRLLQLLLALLKIQTQHSLLSLFFVKLRPQFFVRFEQLSYSPNALDDPIGILMVRCSFHLLFSFDGLEHLNLQKGKLQLFL